MDTSAPPSNPSSSRRIRFEDDLDEHPPGEEIRDKDAAPHSGLFDDTMGVDQDRSKITLAPTPKPQPTALQQKMLAMAGQDIDQFMREVIISQFLIPHDLILIKESCIINFFNLQMEEVHRKREADRQADLDARLAAIAETGEESKRAENRTRDSSLLERDIDQDNDQDFNERDGRNDMDGLPVC